MRQYIVSQKKSLLSLLLCFLFISCKEDAISTKNTNLRPETHISATNIKTAQTSQILVHWYGDDPDGLIIGFLISWDRRNWYFTTKNDSLFLLQIQSNDTNFTFSVAAVDNSVSVLPAINSSVKFIDKNGNGIFDDGEEFSGLQGASDLTPATTTYRIINSPPLVFWGSDSTAKAYKAMKMPDTTFTVASFQFTGFDLDGNKTIDHFEYSLNDSTPTSWKQLSSSLNFFTLTEKDGIITNANNVLYFRSVDIGGLKSKMIQYPQSGDIWYVKKPKGSILVIKDYQINEADAFYIQSLSQIAGGKFAGKFDILNIRDTATGLTHPKNLPPFLSPAFIQTLKLFKAVIWYGDLNPSLAVAQQVLPDYSKSGGKVFFTTSLPSSVEPTGSLVDFAPIDSVSANQLFTSGFAVKNGASISADIPSYPTLLKDNGTVAGVHAFYPKITARSLYHLPGGSTYYSGSPIVGVQSDGKDFFFLNLPLHFFQGNNSAQTLLEQVLTQDFGL